jgi:hypothetical protein
MREKATGVPLEVASRTGFDIDELRELRGLLARLTDRLDAADATGPEGDC